MDNYKRILRDLKIRMINGEEVFKPIRFVRSKKAEKYLKFINKNLTDDIITGSLALYCYGLMDRNLGDIDIIIDDPNRYENYDNDHYHINFNLTGRLGYKQFKVSNLFGTNEYEVDFFKNEGVKFNSVKLMGCYFRVQPPIDVIENKIKIILDNNTSFITRIKHREDIDITLNKIGYDL